ncbi:MAG: TetR/AcrR family transcriptional regulator [Fidelibacterota bacterium]|nr:MAG: TetR/AcrR family transcriptional regulator [Candidatus Neomarinimicrobiota bacterium]
MPRTSKEYNARRQEFLDTAQQLFFQHGYEQTSVNMILDQVGVAKGTFYHYFDSKEDLLNALTDRMVQQALNQLRPIVQDEQLSALDKLNKYFAGSRDFKTENKELIKAWMRVMYKDENIILRHKVRAHNIEIIVPELSKIITQGMEEGIFKVSHPVQTAEMILMLGNDIGDVSADLLLELDEKPENYALIEQRIDQFEQVIARILGTPEGSINFQERKELLQAFRDA